MVDAFEVAKTAVPLIVIFLAMWFVGMQMQGLTLEEGVSSGYTEFYGWYSLQGMITVLFAIVLFSVFKTKWGDVLHIGRWWKVAIFGLFLVFIVMITAGSGQIIPVPKASMQDFQLTPATELYTSSVPPAITEDWNILYFLPYAIALVIFILLENVFGWEVDTKTYIIVGVTACFIASVGYNVWVVPGFVSQHVPAYGQQTEAYVGAWMFAFPQSLIYFFTGWFMPVAHFLHNFIVTYGSIFQIIGGPFMIGGI